MITVRFQFYKPTKHKEETFWGNQKEFTDCANWWLDRIRELKTTSRTKLHRAFYYEARGKFTLLSANLQVALDKAIETYRSYQKKNGKKSTPRFRYLFSCFRQDTFSISEKAIELRFPNRVKVAIPYKVCNPNHKQSLSRKPKRAQLIQKKGKWFLYVSYETEHHAPENDNIIGVDLGVKKLATVSNAEGTMNKFFDGKKAIYIRNKYRRYRQEIQQAKDKGKAKRGYRALKRIARKESTWMTDTNHKISKRIVEIATEHDANVGVENLKGIRERIKATKRVRCMLHSWSFRQLIDFIEYKSAMRGVLVVSVDPRHTSQRCSRCGHISKRNRNSQANFKCEHCGFTINADVNASRNIALSAFNLNGEGQRHSDLAVMLPPEKE